MLFGIDRSEINLPSVFHSSSAPAQRSHQEATSLFPVQHSPSLNLRQIYRHRQLQPLLSASCGSCIGCSAGRHCDLLTPAAVLHRALFARALGRSTDGLLLSFVAGRTGRRGSISRITRPCKELGDSQCLAKSSSGPLLAYEFSRNATSAWSYGKGLALNCQVNKKSGREPKYEQIPSIETESLIIL